MYSYQLCIFYHKTIRNWKIRIEKIYIFLHITFQYYLIAIVHLARDYALR